MKASIADIREEYTKSGLTEDQLLDDPFEMFDRWFDEAMSSEVELINAMTLATASQQGVPSSRIVLLKGVDERGFIFYTNYQSRKAHELLENPNCSLTIFWGELERQVRVVGKAQQISKDESREYFHSRPRESQIGAWASQQSKPLNGREELEERFKNYREKFEGQEIPLPDHWGGFVVVPSEVEFWQGRPNRLHDRFVYEQQGNSWICKRLNP
ncbi:MAG: pyridoxamine 5'-phosphate oxidase [Bacteroidota bacterium]